MIGTFEILENRIKWIGEGFCSLDVGKYDYHKAVYETVSISDKKSFILIYGNRIQKLLNNIKKLLANKIITKNLARYVEYDTGLYPGYSIAAVDSYPQDEDMESAVEYKECDTITVQQNEDAYRTELEFYKEQLELAFTKNKTTANSEGNPKKTNKPKNFFKLGTPLKEEIKLTKVLNLEIENSPLIKDENEIRHLIAFLIHGTKPPPNIKFHFGWHLRYIMYLMACLQKKHLITNYQSHISDSKLFYLDTGELVNKKQMKNQKDRDKSWIKNSNKRTDKIEYALKNFKKIESLFKTINVNIDKPFI